MIQFNTVVYDFNKGEFITFDVIPYLAQEYFNSEKKPCTYEEFKSFILEKSKYEWWGRCEYEIILVDWPCKKHCEKHDVYDQIKINIDIVTYTLMRYIDAITIHK